MKKLHQLISEKESELQNLEDSLGLGFPIVEQAKMTQISHLRLELEDLRQIEKSIQLNDNQKIVLDWLKDEMNASSVTNALWLLLDDALEVDYDTDASGMWNRLPKDQQFQVLAAFAEWGLSHAEE